MGNKKRILIVEDDDDIAKNLKKLLEAEGYAAETARNGKVALERLQSAPELPSLILLDLMMPVMDGFQFREQQEKNAQTAVIPIVIMTAGGNIESSKLRLGAKAYVVKPPDAEILIKVIREYAK